jgi:hypothetical protein
MSQDNKVQLDEIHSSVGANPTKFSAALNARVNSLQQQSAGLDSAYQSYILGGNRDQLGDYFTDGQSLTHQMMLANVLRSYNRNAATEQIAEQKAGTDAYKGMTELAKG